MTRSFFYWPDFMPGPQRDRREDDRALRRLPRPARRARLTTIPTFIVGHMSGENWDPAWRSGRDLYARRLDGRPPGLVRRARWSAASRDHPAVAGWLVSNEMPIYGGSDNRPRDRRRLGADHQGRGARGRRPAAVLARRRRLGHRGHRHRQRLPARRHRRRSPTSSARTSTRSATTRSGSSYAAALACELAGTFGKPVIMEEFGVSSDFASDANAATYYRHVLHSTLLAGATGWIAWNNTDFALAAPGPVPAPRLRAELRAHRRPRHAEGRRSARCGVRRRRSTPSTTPDASAPTPTPRSSCPATWTPSTRSPRRQPRRAVAKALHQGYLAARLADLPPRLTRESDGIEPGARLYLAPSVKQILAPTAARPARPRGRGRVRLRLLLAPATSPGTAARPSDG